jgi:DNA-binding MarR family transcriptional regulator
VYRSEEDLALLAELAGVLDATVVEAGLSAGSYLVLREVVAGDGGGIAVGALAERLGAGPEEVAEMGRRLNAAGLVEVRGGGLAATVAGRERLARVEDDANTAMRAYVLERPHTATVYGLVAAMQTGRFTLEDLLEFIAEGPTEED